MFRAYWVWLACGLSSFGFAQSSNAPSTSNPPASNHAVSHDQSPGQAAVSLSQRVAATEVSVATESPNIKPVPRGLEEAFLLYRKGNFSGALEKYELVLKERPQSPDALAGEVRTYLKMKNVEQAAAVAEKGLAASNSPRVRSARAEVWFRQGRISDAEREWVAVINSGYPEPRAYLGLARVRGVLAKYKGEKAMLDKAHELDPYDSDIQQQWMETLSLAERIRYLQTALTGDNSSTAGEREDMASYLAYLNARVRQKGNSCQLVSKVTTTETPLVRLLSDPQHLRGYGLSVFLNGHKTSLLLDTGASGILIDRPVAEHSGITKIETTEVWGIGKKGVREAYSGVADSIKIGDLEFRNCPVEVRDSRSVVGDSGLIGADVFEQFLVDIDFPNEKLRLSQLPKRPGETEQSLVLKSEDSDGSDDNEAAEADADKPTPTATPKSSGPQDSFIAPEMQSYTHLLRFGHDLLVPTTIGNVPYKLFLLDTGSLTNFISPAAAREVTKVHGDSDTTIEGISGRVDKVFSANKAILQFGHLKQENQDMTAFDITSVSDSLGTEVSGFLGFTTLRFLDVKIDYRDALIDFKYDAKRWGR
jgi:tetratricopeptide (TPR) repeat protein